MPTLLEFIKQYYDQPNVGDTDANKGQCVGLIEVWTDALGLPHTYGNAKDLLNDADSNFFDIIQNSPTGFPLPGDVFVFGDTYGAGYGHTGVVVYADANLVTLFQQNDGLNGGTPQLKTYNYGGALGWLHPKNITGIDDLQNESDYRQTRDNNWNLYQNTLKSNESLTIQLTKCQTDLSSCQSSTQPTTSPNTEVIVKPSDPSSTVPSTPTTPVEPPTSPNPPPINPPATTPSNGNILLKFWKWLIGSH